MSLDAEFSGESNPKMASCETSKSTSPCSICLEPILDSKQRSIAILKCSHEFHLDCIGSAFNSKGIMQCPNCRSIENGEWLFASGLRSTDPAYFDEYEFNLDRELFLARLHGFSSSHDFEDIDEFEDEPNSTEAPDDSYFPSETPGTHVDAWDSYSDYGYFPPVTLENHEEDIHVDVSDHRFNGSRFPVPSLPTNPSPNQNQNQSLSQSPTQYPSSSYFCPFANTSLFSPAPELHAAPSDQGSRFYSYINHLQSQRQGSFSSPYPPPLQSQSFLSQPFPNHRYPSPLFSTLPFPNSRYSSPAFSASPFSSSLSPSPPYTNSLFPYSVIPNMWESSDRGSDYQQPREWRNLFPHSASPYPENPSFPHTYSSHLPPFPRQPLSSWSDEPLFRSIPHRPLRDLSMRDRSLSILQFSSRLSSDTDARPHADTHLSSNSTPRTDGNESFSHLMEDHLRFGGDRDFRSTRVDRVEERLEEGRQDLWSRLSRSRARERSERREENNWRVESATHGARIPSSENYREDLDWLFRERRGRRDVERSLENVTGEKRDGRDSGEAAMDDVVQGGPERRDYGFESMWRERTERRERNRNARFSFVLGGDRGSTLERGERGERKMENDGHGEERRGQENTEGREKDKFWEMEERTRKDLREREKEKEREREREMMREVEREITRSRDREREREGESEMEQTEGAREREKERERSARLERDERRGRITKEEKSSRIDREGNAERRKDKEASERTERGEKIEVVGDRDVRADRRNENPWEGRNRRDRRENWSDFRSPIRFHSIYGNNRSNSSSAGNNSSNNSGSMSSGRNGEGVLHRQEWRIKSDPTSSPTSILSSSNTFPSTASMCVHKEKKMDENTFLSGVITNTSDKAEESVNSVSTKIIDPSLPSGNDPLIHTNSNSPANEKYGDPEEYFLSHRFDSVLSDVSHNINTSHDSQSNTACNKCSPSNDVDPGSTTASNNDYDSSFTNGEFFCHFHEFTTRHAKKFSEYKGMDLDKNLTRKDVQASSPSIPFQDSDSLLYVGRMDKARESETANKMKLNEDLY